MLHLRLFCMSGPVSGPHGNFLKASVMKMCRTGVLFALVAYGVACVCYTARTGDVLAAGLAWNMVLAALPLFVFRAARRCKAAAAAWALKLVWLLLLPNTFYLLTDLIHVPPRMEWVEQLEAGGAVVRHSALVREWVLMLLIGAGACFGVMLGCRALYEFEKSLPAAFGAAGRWLCVGGLCVLSAAGAYIGRFLRFNSWDILHPLHLARTLLASADTLAVQFTVCMAACIFFLYVFCRRLFPAQR